MKTLAELRSEIDAVDRELAQLLARRFRLTDEVGEIKRSAGLEVLDASRERMVSDAVAVLAGENLADDVREVYAAIMTRSRIRQQRLQEGGKL